MWYPNLVALAGGVGGARMADGFARLLPPHLLTVIVNIGDDFEHFGLKICPDLDTVCYTLAGLSNPEVGWGRAGESFTALEACRQLGGPDWFRLGDLDLGTHLVRTERLRQGESLSTVTADFCRAWGIGPRILPASDDPVPTIVLAREESGAPLLTELPFQDYFVRLRCQPQVAGFQYQGLEQARPAPGVLEAIRTAGAVVICPSNPWVSVDPLLSIPGIREALVERRQVGAPVVAVSPILGTETVKGPAAKMFAELGIQPSALAVARHYQDLLTGFVLDNRDAGQVPAVQALGMQALATDILMRDEAGRARLAGVVLNFCTRLSKLPVRPSGEIP